jgi:macrodomain Ter protein organizer (MatP/YcbG family)
MKRKDRARKKTTLDDESKRKVHYSVNLESWVWDAIESLTNNRSSYIQNILENVPELKKLREES